MKTHGTALRKCSGAAQDAPVRPDPASPSLLSREGAGVGPEASEGRDAAPFIEGYLLYLLARASHALSAEFHPRLRRLGVSVAEWRVLATLSGTGSSAGGTPRGETVGALAAACLMQQPTTTKLLDRMERAGLVARVADPGDRRRVTVVLTEAGRRRVAGLLEAARAHEARRWPASGPLGEELKDALRRLLAQGEGPEQPERRR
jgi:DNA-binding MarR family transcriptional regulator